MTDHPTREEVLAKLDDTWRTPTDIAYQLFHAFVPFAHADQVAELLAGLANENLVDHTIGHDYNVRDAHGMGPVYKRKTA